MRRVVLALCVWVSGCAVITQPASSLSPTFRAWQHLSVIEESGSYPGDWVIAGDSLAPQLAKLEAWADGRGYVRANVSLAAKQDYLGATVRSQLVGWIILIDQDQSVNLRFYTLLHEIAHILEPRNVGMTASESEVFAELTAAQVAETVGLNAWPQTAAYLRVHATMDEQSRVAYKWGPEIDRCVRLLASAL